MPPANPACVAVGVPSVQLSVDQGEPPVNRPLMATSGVNPLICAVTPALRFTLVASTSPQCIQSAVPSVVRFTTDGPATTLPESMAPTALGAGSSPSICFR